MSRLEEEMRRLLQTERDMLFNGDLNALPELARQKEQMVPNMRSLAPDARKRLAVELDQNHALLGAAMRGLRGAIRRINAISGAGAPLQTYGANGDRAALEHPRKRDLERRA